MADSIQNIKLGGTSYPVEDTTARANAIEALSIADTAKTTADTAKSTANTAKSTANTAKSTADTALATTNGKVSASYENSTNTLILS